MNQNKVDLQSDIINASFKQPIVVDFWAAWCAPCRMLGPILEKLAKQANGRWRLIKIDTESQPELAQQFGIQSIPAVKMVSEGRLIAEFVGALPEPQVIKWLNEYLPTKSKNAVEQAMQALELGDANRAKQFLKYAIDQDASNLDAKVMLARLIFIDDPEKAIQMTEGIDEGHAMFDQIDAMRNLYRLIHSSKELIAEAQKQKTEAWTLYGRGIEAFKRHDYQTSLESWIDSIIIDRQVDNDGARKACVALFKILGSEHELTKKYHRRFSSALF